MSQNQLPAWLGTCRSPLRWAWCFVVSERAALKLGLLRVTMMLPSSVSPLISLLSWMVFANHCVTTWVRKGKGHLTNLPYAIILQPSILRKTHGNWNRFLGIDSKLYSWSTKLLPNWDDKSSKLNVPTTLHPPSLLGFASQDDVVTFCPAMDENMDTQSACAKSCSTLTWKSTWTCVAWHFRSTLQGLQPIRPVVISTRLCELEPGSLLMVEWFHWGIYKEWIFLGNPSIF